MGTALLYVAVILSVTTWVARSPPAGTRLGSSPTELCPCLLHRAPVAVVTDPALTVVAGALTCLLSLRGLVVLPM